jgi:hypothetical protein
MTSINRVAPIAIPHCDTPTLIPTTLAKSSEAEVVKPST